MKTKKVGEIFETTDYKSFKLLKENREVLINKSLEKSLIESGQLQPGIVVKGKIIDGQHRLSICKKHKIPFTYLSYNDEIIKNEHIIPLNVTGTSWSIYNYINHYAKRGNKECKALLKMVQKYDTFSPATVADACSANAGGSNRLIKSGNYKIVADRGEKILNFVKIIDESGMISKLGKRAISPHFVRTIKNFMCSGAIKNFDMDVLFKKLAHCNKLFVIYGNEKEVFKELKKVYKKQITE